MRFRSIPRHQIETAVADYARMAAALVGLVDRGAAVTRFESIFRDYVGCRHAISVSSGRIGLDLVLRRLAMERGSEAIVPAFNYFMVVERFLAAGLRPVFADIRRADLNIDPACVESLVTPRTRVLLATHMYGHPCDMDALGRIAARHNLLLIEDCAHAFGSLHRGRHVGAIGKAGVFSLSVLKLVTAFGGGVITTDDDELAGGIREDIRRRSTPGTVGSRLRSFLKGMSLDMGTRTLPFSLVVWPLLRIARWLRPDVQQRLMTEVPRRAAALPQACDAPFEAFQAVLGRSQVRRAGKLIERRRRVLEQLDAELRNIDGVTRLQRSPHVRHNGMYYGILVDQPQQLSDYLFSAGIDSETAEYQDCAGLSMYREFGGDCPVARDVRRRILRLPSHPGLQPADVRCIAGAIRAFHEQAAATVSFAAAEAGP